MTLEELVPTLEVCQQLQKAGFPQDTVMVWVNAPQGFISGGGLYMDENGIHRTPEIPSKGYADEVMLRSAVNTLHTVLCGAPTAGELEEWLMTQGFFSRRTATLQIAYRAVKVGEALDPISYTSVRQDEKWVGHYIVTAFNGGGESIGMREMPTRVDALGEVVLEIMKLKEYV